LYVPARLGHRELFKGILSGFFRHLHFDHPSKRVGITIVTRFLASDQNQFICSLHAKPLSIYRASFRKRYARGAKSGWRFAGAAGTKWCSMGRSTYQLPEDGARRLDAKEVMLAHFVSPLAFRRTRFADDDPDQLPVWMPDGRQRSEETIWKQEIVVAAVIHGSEVGRATFTRFGEGISGRSDPTVWTGYSLGVGKKYRRCGIGRAMYGHVKAFGYPISPSEALTDDGLALWLCLDPSLQAMPGRPRMNAQQAQNTQTDALRRSLWTRHRPPRTLDWHIKQRSNELSVLYPDLATLHQRILLDLQDISQSRPPLLCFLKGVSSMQRRKSEMDDSIEVAVEDLGSIFGYLPKVWFLDRWLKTKKERALRDALDTLSNALSAIGSQMDSDLKIAERVPKDIATFVPKHWAGGY
jgi:hypothetical protein